MPALLNCQNIIVLSCKISDDLYISNLLFGKSILSRMQATVIHDQTQTLFNNHGLLSNTFRCSDGDAYVLRGQHRSRWELNQCNIIIGTYASMQIYHTKMTTIIIGDPSKTRIYTHSYSVPCRNHINQHWNGNVVILMKLSSLAGPEVVILTTSGATNYENASKWHFRLSVGKEKSRKCEWYDESSVLPTTPLLPTVR